MTYSSKTNQATVVECHDSSDDPAVAKAIAFCGRIFRDLGAQVITSQAPGLTDGADWQFLTAQKTIVAALDVDALVPGALLLGGSARLPENSISVRVRLEPGPGPAGPASAFTIAAETGLLDIVGDPEREPLTLPLHQLAKSAGLAAYAAGAALLFAGVPAQAEVSLRDVASWLNWKNLIVADANGTSPSRLGRGSEWQVVRCADGWIGLVYRDQDWAALKSLVGDPALDDPVLNIRANRRRDASRIAGIVETSFRDKTRDEIMAYASRHRIPLGPVLTTGEVVQDAQSVARKAFRSVDGRIQPRLPALWNGRAPYEGKPIA